jgi:hypothetical protein
LLRIKRRRRYAADVDTITQPEYEETCNRRKKGVPVTWRSKIRSTDAPERAMLERFAKDARRFPGGEDPTRHCTGCARLVTEGFGGEIRGYWTEDNPLATAAAAEGGHDFALIAGRFIVDPWLYHYYGESPVLDLGVPAERAEAACRYGRWKIGNVCRNGRT